MVLKFPLIEVPIYRGSTAYALYIPEVQSSLIQRTVSYFPEDSRTSTNGVAGMQVFSGTPCLTDHADDWHFWEYNNSSLGTLSIEFHPDLTPNWSTMIFPNFFLN